MTVLELLNIIGNTNHCVVKPPTGKPILPNGHSLPHDVVEFYKLCDGVELYSNKECGITVVSANEFASANLAILGAAHPEDRSSEWYIIAKQKNGRCEQVITIDCGNRRSGYCYDSFWDRHGVAGSCAIIASVVRQI